MERPLYVLVETSRRDHLAGTDLAQSQVDKIRLKLFKVTARVTTFGWSAAGKSTATPNWNGVTQSGQSAYEISELGESGADADQLPQLLLTTVSFKLPSNPFVVSPLSANLTLSRLDLAFQVLFGSDWGFQ